MIVIDMDTPKSCTYCPCATEDFGETRCVLGSPDIDWNERPCTCPMIKADGLISKEEVLRYISHKNCIESEEMLRGKEPCEDAISRQAMLNGLASIAKVKARSDAQKALMGRVMFFTEQLPPISPKPTECVDAVKREAVLNTLDTMDKALDENRTVEAYKELLKECYKELPTVTPKPKWIPVSERLPEDRREVLVTAYWHETYQVMMASYFGDGLWWCVPFNNCGEHMQRLNPKAWMPLPAPYKEGESE